MGVLLFHISPATLKGGFTGVDVFFVLSGFLITTIILQDMRDGAFSLLDFYLRRIQRLLPNVLVTVLAVVVLWAIFMPPMAVQTGRHGLWTIFNLSNFYIWRNLGGYWDDASSWAPLLHTWSLAVEEQFYLLYPIALLLLYRLGKARPIAWLAAAVLLSFGLCVYASRAHPAANFYMLPTRLWELVLGGMLAAYRAGVPGIAPRPLLQGPKTREIVGWAGLCCILGGFAFINEEAGFPGVVALVPTLGTAMVLASVADGSTRVSRLLSARLIVGVGALSYSLYLWHWPLITLGKFHADLHGEPQLVGATLGAVAGGLLACLAFVGVEKPLRSRDPGRARRFAIIAGLLCAVAIVSAFVGHRHTIPDPEHTFDSPSFHGFLYSAGKSVDPAKLSSASKFRDVYFPPSPPRADDAWRTGGIVRLYGGGTPRVVVMGDSHALMYSRVIDDICKTLGLSVAFLGVDQTPAFFSARVNERFPSAAEAIEFDEARRKWLREWHPDALLVIARMDGFISASNAFDSKLRSFLEEVSPLTGRVLLVAQVPAAKWGEEFNLREFMVWRMKAGNGIPRLDLGQGDHRRIMAIASAEAASAQFGNLSVLRPDKLFLQKDGSIKWSDGRSFFYADEDHLTESGADVARPLLERAIADATSLATRIRD
jgi:peptidoglycan/LPS O-acetylase OafA/YrhL